MVAGLTITFLNQFATRRALLRPAQVLPLVQAVIDALQRTLGLEVPWLLATDTKVLNAVSVGVGVGVEGWVG